MRGVQGNVGEIENVGEVGNVGEIENVDEIGEMRVEIGGR